MCGTGCSIYVGYFLWNSLNFVSINERASSHEAGSNLPFFLIRGVVSLSGWYATFHIFIRLCMASAVAGYLSSLGSDEPAGAYEDIEKPA